MSGIDGEGQRLLGQLLKISGLSGRQSGEDAPEKSLSDKFNSVTRWFGRRSSLMAPLAEQQIAQLLADDLDGSQASSRADGKSEGGSQGQGGSNTADPEDLRAQITTLILTQGVSVAAETEADSLLQELSPGEVKSLAIGGLDFTAKELATQLHAMLGAPALDVEEGEYLVDPFPAAVRSHIDANVTPEELKEMLEVSLNQGKSESEMAEVKIRPSRNVLGIANRLPEPVVPGKNHFSRGDYIFLGSEGDYPFPLEGLVLNGQELPVSKEQGNWMARGLEFGDHQIMHGFTKLSDASIVPLSINISVAG